MIRAFLLSFALLLCATASHADCIANGESVQSVTLSVDGKSVDRWEAVAGQVHQTKLPGGFTVGIQIDPAAAETYREWMTKFRARAADELAKIMIYDASQTPPKLLSMNWGGSNSKQGFGPRGGANRVAELVDQIELWLRKPACVTEESLKSSGK